MRIFSLRSWNIRMLPNEAERNLNPVLNGFISRFLTDFCMLAKPKPCSVRFASLLECPMYIWINCNFASVGECSRNSYQVFNNFRLGPKFLLWIHFVLVLYEICSSLSPWKTNSFSTKINIITVSIYIVRHTVFALILTLSKSIGPRVSNRKYMKMKGCLLSIAWIQGDTTDFARHTALPPQFFSACRSRNSCVSTSSVFARIPLQDRISEWVEIHEFAQYSSRVFDTHLFVLIFGHPVATRPLIQIEPPSCQNWMQIFTSRNHYSLTFISQWNQAIAIPSGIRRCPIVIYFLRSEILDRISLTSEFITVLQKQLCRFGHRLLTCFVVE